MRRKALLDERRAAALISDPHRHDLRPRALGCQEGSGAEGADFVAGERRAFGVHEDAAAARDAKGHGVDDRGAAALVAAIDEERAHAASGEPDDWPPREIGPAHRVGLDVGEVDEDIEHRAVVHHEDPADPALVAGRVNLPRSRCGPFAVTSSP